MQFEFSTVSKIIFGIGKLNSIGGLIHGIGNKALIISGAPTEITSRLSILVSDQGIQSTILRVETEPTLDQIRHAVSLARRIPINLIIGIGGGSAIDTAKATAVLVSNPGDITDYLEVIGANKPLISAPIPLIAIPTTAGTGSEVTKNAVIEAPEYHVKVSLRSSYLFPRIALADPELTKSLPPDITAQTGLDALTQLIEPYTCNAPNPLTDGLCREGIRRIARSFTKAYADGNNLEDREDMLLASLFSGLALANAKLGAVHGLAGPIGGEIAAPHGAICARLLPEVMQINVHAMRDRSPVNPALGRYDEIGKLLTGIPNATVENAIQWVEEICKHMRIKPLSSFGLQESVFSAILEKATKASSMKGNPITLSEDELRNVLRKSLHP